MAREKNLILLYQRIEFSAGNYRNVDDAELAAYKALHSQLGGKVTIEELKEIFYPVLRSFGNW